MTTTIKNGDVFDIGQTVNGVSKFMYYNDKWYYYRGNMTREYEYDQNELTSLIVNDYEDEITYLGNIFDNIDE